MDIDPPVGQWKWRFEILFETPDVNTLVDGGTGHKKREWKVVAERRVLYQVDASGSFQPVNTHCQ